MPNVSLKLTRPQAVDICNIIPFLGGDVNFKEDRSQFFDNIVSAWPEVEKPDSQTPPEMERSVEYTSEQQMAMAEGLFSFCVDPKTKGAAYTAARKVGKICQLNGWLKTHIAAIPSPKFKGALDCDPPLLDTAAPAAKPD